MSTTTRYIGTEGAAFERLGIVFEAMGYRKPAPEFDGAGGNYVTNIIGQYQSDLSADDVQTVIDFSRRSRDDLRAMLAGLSSDAAESYVLNRR